MTSMLFAALNQTIIGTTIPKISAELENMQFSNWIFIIYMLTSSISAILVGKLSDMYGRRTFVLMGLFIFLVASILCGFSTSMYQLIGFRGLQGIGGGMIISMSFTIVGDLFVHQERIKWQGIVTSVFGLASVFGPTLGGFIVDHMNWSWVFWIFTPVGVVAFILIYKLLPKHALDKKQKVDYLGALFLALSIFPLLVGVTLLGTNELFSFSVLSLLLVSSIFFLVFIRTENRAINPIIPLGLFKNKTFSATIIISFLLGVGMFGTMIYTPFFIQGVTGSSATKSGFFMMPMMISSVLASFASGHLQSKVPKYKTFALIGLSIMSIGTFFMATNTINTKDISLVLYMFLIGVGLGVCFPIFTTIIQNSVSNKDLGVATASTQLFRQLGGTIGVSFMGLLLNRKIDSHIIQENQEYDWYNEYSPSQVLMDNELLELLKSEIPPHFYNMFDSLVNSLRIALNNALQDIFIISGIALLIALSLTFLIKRGANEQA